MGVSRRELLKAAALIVADHLAIHQEFAFGGTPRENPDRKIILVACGGMRRAETFSASGLVNIQHLYHDLLPNSVLYLSMRNDGVTSHYNTISSILTGDWQRLDDWGKTAPSSPTIFEYVRKGRKLAQGETWLISSNKALTSRIGASATRDFGPPFGANVVFPKQLLINAVVRAAEQGRAVHSTDRAVLEPEITSTLNANNYEGLGWSVFGDSISLDSSTLGIIQEAIGDLVRTSAPVTGDEFTYLVSAEIMRRFAPSLLTITFSDMEVAHFGSYSLHLAGIRTVDRLVYELWDHVQSLPAYKGKTTMFVLPEFGRDMDGSTTNGFFNHRQNDNSTRQTWMVCIGEGVRKAQIIDKPVQQIDICPTIAQMFGLKNHGLPGKPLEEIWI